MKCKHLNSVLPTLDYLIGLKLQNGLMTFFLAITFSKLATLYEVLLHEKRLSLLAFLAKDRPFRSLVVQTKCGTFLNY